ncbi:hypothetical protein EJ04DRAFT_451713 [Polyplosphaeria fusca]|uniref:Rhodopsin domain-containing protein n=1 Tax=Polyplosphaeria fusca TaxID=682080 RepID=A0A9P4QH79_9PLEO|nr:hypothetical protein EJ04DRAFT_451713 [Polyplosphaeria fusca]
MSLDYSKLPELTPEYLAEDVSQPMWNASIAFIVLETLFVALFFASRYLSNTMHALEVWLFMPLGWLVCVGLCVTTLRSLGGAGTHLLVLAIFNPARLVVWYKTQKAIEYLYLMAVSFPKLAIICLYLRLFGSERGLRCAALATGVLVSIIAIAGIFVSSFMCRPFAYNWNKTIPGGQCGQIETGYRMVSIPNIVTDVVMLVLPLPALWRLKVDLATKLSLTATFVVGSIGIVTSIVRLFAFINGKSFEDPRHIDIQPSLWTVIEPGVYLITACLPSLRPLKRLLFGDRGITQFIVRRVEGTKKSHLISLPDIRITRSTFVELKDLEKEAGDTKYGRPPVLEKDDRDLR